MSFSDSRTPSSSSAIRMRGLGMETSLFRLQTSDVRRQTSDIGYEGYRWAWIRMCSIRPFRDRPHKPIKHTSGFIALLIKLPVLLLFQVAQPVCEVHVIAKLR